MRILTTALRAGGVYKGRKNSRVQYGVPYAPARSAGVVRPRDAGNGRGSKKGFYRIRYPETRVRSLASRCKRLEVTENYTGGLPILPERAAGFTATAREQKRKK